MATARTTLVNALAKFTTLDSVRAMEARHVECVKSLLLLAVTDGNNLSESWAPVLQCVSRLARLQDTAQGAASDETFFSSPSNAGEQLPPPPAGGAAKATGSFGFMFGTGPSPHEAAQAVEELNAEHLVEVGWVGLS